MIPLFPLNTVLCPHETISLHIFEERYKEMITQCIEESRPFGVILVYDGSMLSIGCTAEISEVNKVYSDGKMDIRAIGIQRFNLVSLDRRFSYLRAYVTYFEDDNHHVDISLKQQVADLHHHLLLSAEAPIDDTIYQHQHSSFIISHSAGLELMEKQKMMEMRSENERLHFLKNHLTEAIEKIKNYEKLKILIHSNGHYQQFPPMDLNLFG